MIDRIDCDRERLICASLYFRGARGDAAKIRVDTQLPWYRIGMYENLVELSMSYWFIRLIHFPERWILFVLQQLSFYYNRNRNERWNSCWFLDKRAIVLFGDGWRFGSFCLTISRNFLRNSCSITVRKPWWRCGCNDKAVKNSEWPIKLGLPLAS